MLNLNDTSHSISIPIRGISPGDHSTDRETRGCKKPSKVTNTVTNTKHKEGRWDRVS